MKQHGKGKEKGKKKMLGLEDSVRVCVLVRSKKSGKVEEKG